MCGIAGILKKRGATPDHALFERQVERQVERMIATLAHRGPDGSGLHVEGPVGLGHARLAILDLAGGAQPLSNEDGQVWVTFNGEIYNHRALRAELAARHTFRTQSDTEVLVHLYEERGPSFVDALEGFFAFALWDARSRRLVLARDRLGKKPLFLRETDDALYFASEPRALLAASDLRPEPDPRALADVLALRCVRGTRSGYAGISRLAPGELAVLELDAPEPRLATRRYWSLPAPSDPGTGPEAAAGADPQNFVDAFRARFDAAVARRLEADVPLGLLLSGGIDSTAVLESLSRVANGRVRTFTVAFSRAADSEARAARALAEHFGTEHEEFDLSERELLDHVATVLPHLDEPFADPSFLPTTLVCGLARRAVTVALGGDGGDELFGGYDRYARTLAHAGGASRPSLAQRLTGSVAARMPWGRDRGRREPAGRGWKRARAGARATLSPEAYYASELVATEPALRACLVGPRLAESALGSTGSTGSTSSTGRASLEARLAGELAGPAPLAARLMAHDLGHYLPELILTKVDRASMARSLEMRAPFLDRELVEWAQSVPVAVKLQGGERKRLVRAALAGRVPQPLLDLPKKGFGTPLGRWFRKDLRAYAEDHLGASRLAADGWIDPRGVRSVLDAHARKRRNLGETLWTLLALEVWYRTWC